MVFGLAVVVASQAPHLWAMRAQRHQYHPELVYAGQLPLYLDDATADWAFMRQAKAGHFLMSDPYTPDPHPRNYVNVFLWFLGAVARVTSSDVRVVYEISKFAFSGLLLVMLYLLAARLFEKPWERLLAFAMMTLGSGWDGPIAFLQRHAGASWSASSPGWWMPEISTFFSMILFPHLVAGFAAIVAVALLMLSAWDDARDPRRRLASSAGAGLILFAVLLFHPYDTVTALGMIWGTVLLIGVAGRRLPRAEAVQALVASAVALPAAGYDLFLITTNPAIRAWHEQNVMVTPAVGAMFMCFGVNLVLAIVLLPRFRSLARPQLVMLGWAASAFVLIALPWRFQRRMMGGLQIPLAALACTAVVLVLVPLASRAIARWRAVPDPSGARALAFLLLLAPLDGVMPCYVHQGQWREVRALKYPSWLRAEEFEAMSVLGATAPPGSIAISSYEIGNFLPSLTSVAVYWGHPALTIDSKDRGADVKRFYSAGPEDDAWRRELLARFKIAYVFYTPRERALGAFDPSSRPWLEEVYVTGSDPERRAAIYKVR